MTESADALLPVLVAELADDDARRQVMELAEARATALIPLIDAPVDASLHVLEVTTPGQSEPLLVLAEPVGVPTERGFPLRLHPYGSPPPSPSMRPPPGPSMPSLRATRTRPVTLTKHHTRDLLGDYSAQSRPEGAAAATPEALLGRELAGKLVVEKLVGVGGMGAVYLARHKQLGNEVAVKVLHEHFRADLQFCARFHAEALVVSQLDHPNLVRIIDYGQEPDGLLYLAMDYLSGMELSELLSSSGTLPLARIIDIAMQAAAGLGHAHARGIIHRDVKPSNIVLVKSDDDEGRPVELVKVCDFGIAAQGATTDMLGTPAYMSPEQCSGLELDGRSDVYSLGVILYELATGQLPFSSDDAAQVVIMQREKPPPMPSLIRQVDARLESLILRMLAKSPDARPQNMRDLRADLRNLTRPPSLQLHDVGVGRGDRGSQTHATVPELAPAGGGAPEAAASPAPPRAASVGHMEAAIDPRALAGKLASEPISTLREAFAAAQEKPAEAQVLAGAMRLMLERRELAALAKIVATLANVARDPEGGAGSDLALRLVRTLQDPVRLAPVAEHALAEHDDAAPALLACLGLAAAHALYEARVRAHPTPPLRARFVSAVRGIGSAAWPLVSAALLRNAPGDAAQHDPRLAEDVLRAMPLASDDAAGGVVSKYLRWGEAPVRRAAIPPLVTLWGNRARPLLLAVLLKDPDEGARVAAIRGLRDLRAIDDHVVRKAEEILGNSGAGGTAALVAMAEALGDAHDDARPLAVAALRRALTPKGGMFAVLRKSTPTAPPVVVIAMARSLVAIGGADGIKHVEEYAKHCDEPLRTQVLGAVPSK